MPKRNLSTEAIANAVRIHSTCAGLLGSRGNAAMVFRWPISTIGEENCPGYVKTYLKIFLRNAPHTSRFYGDMEIILYIRYNYANRMRNGSVSYDYMSHVSIARDFHINMVDAPAKDIIIKLANACEGVLRDEKVIVKFHLEHVLPFENLLEKLQSSFLPHNSYHPFSSWRTCEILTDSKVFPPEPVKCLTHGEWGCLRYLRNWVSARLHGKEPGLTEILRPNYMGRGMLKPLAVMQEIEAFTPRIDEAIARMQVEVNKVEVIRRMAIRSLAPILKETL